MTSNHLTELPSPGTNCNTLFRKAYENRYTWDSSFQGYKGNFIFIHGQAEANGTFKLNNDFKVIINFPSDENVVKEVSSQLFEVGIHRIRRPFNEVHSDKNFIAADMNESGLKLIVEGNRDMYRVKNNVITMVHRHIHGKLIQIHTDEIIDTGKGYLSKSYTSQYLDPISHKAVSIKNIFTDTFVNFEDQNIWVLSERKIQSCVPNPNSNDLKIYRFNSFSALG